MKNIDKNKKTIEAYDNNAQFYADKFDSYGARVEDIDRALQLNISDSRKSLELGSSNGRDARYISFRVGINNYIGIDASSGLVDLAKINLPKVEFYVRDVRLVDFEPDSFGLVISFFTMLHANRAELANVLLKCNKWLKIGGILYISGRYGDYREIEVKNLGDVKYYYSYKPEDLEELGGDGFETVYKVIHDSEYGPSFTLALRKRPGPR